MEKIEGVLLHTERLKILQALSKGPSTLPNLLEQVGGSFSSLLHHLRVLRDAGIVEVVKLKPRLSIAYLKFDVELSYRTGGETVVKLSPRPPPAESELMTAYWKILLKK